MSPERARGSGLSRAGFVALLVVFAALELAFVANVVRWRGAPDIGWMPTPEFGPKRVGLVSAWNDSSGFRRGDRILSIGGETYDTQDELLRLIDFSIGGVTVYELERDGKPFLVTVKTREMGWRRVLFQSGLICLAGAAYVAIAFIVFGMKPYRFESWAFLAMAGTAGVFITYRSPSYFFAPPVLENIPLLAGPFLGATILHLAAVFPERRVFFLRHPIAMAVPYLVSLALAVVTRASAERIAKVPAEILTVTHVYLFGSLLAFAASTLHGYRKSAPIAVRVQASVILAGIVVATIIPSLELLTNQVLKKSLFPNPILFNLVFLLFFPLSIGYAIVRHDLFEVNAVVKRTYGYVLSTAAVVVGYVLAVSTLDMAFHADLSKSPGFSLAFVLGVLFVAEPSYRRLQQWIDRVFYRQRYDYRRTLREAIETMAGILDPEALRAALLDTVVGAMFLENGALLLSTNGTRTYRPALVRGPIEAPVLPADDPLVRLVGARANGVFRHDVELDPDLADDQARLRQAFDALGAELVLPVRSKEALRGVLSLGRKKSGKMFTREDLDLLRTLAGQTAIAIENATLFDDLAESLKQNQILESVKTHLSKFVPRTVQSLIEASPDAPDFTKREADVTVLFTDITGYTKLSTELPIDEVNDIVERYFGAFLDEIESEGGDVNETAGDGLMIIFQQSDLRAQAAAAVRAAVGILRRARELNEAAEGKHAPIGIHIGINSGTASVGATKIRGAQGDRWTYTASGPTTNVAARLCALGHGDAVILSEATRERLAETFELEDLGTPPLKNVTKPIRIWRLVAADEAPLEYAARAAAL